MIIVIIIRDTSIPAVNTKAGVDALFEFIQDGATVSLGSAYYGSWPDEKTVQILITEASGADDILIGKLQIRVRDGSIKIKGDSTSVNDLSLSPSLVGDWGHPVKISSLYYVFPALLFFMVLLFAITLIYRQKSYDEKKKLSSFALGTTDQPWY